MATIDWSELGGREEASSEARIPRGVVSIVGCGIASHGDTGSYRKRERGREGERTYCSIREEVKDMKGERRTLKLCQPFQEMKKGGYAVG